MTFTKEELNEIIYCMDEMLIAYKDDDPGIQDWTSAYQKLTEAYDHDG
tara:strand:+ start:41 stop:184 length:144 start_codon:yes stop_codon:yes gene_type:complete